MLECLRNLAEGDAVLCAVLDFYSSNSTPSNYLLHSSNSSSGIGNNDSEAAALNNNTLDEPSESESDKKRALKTCVETILKYLENIIANPTEAKFRKIRMNNKNFSEKIGSVQKAVEIFTAIGFTHVIEPVVVSGNDTATSSQSEPFLVLDSSIPSTTVQYAKECLIDGPPTPPKPLLFRDTKVFTSPSSNSKSNSNNSNNNSSSSADKFNLPDSFFELTKQEIKKQSQRQREELENSKMLKTKAMREEEKKNSTKNYLITCIRFKLPDGVAIQMLFEATETVGSLYTAFSELLQPQFSDTTQPQPGFSFFQPATLKTATSEGFDSVEMKSKPLKDVQLVPTATIMVKFPSIASCKSSDVLKSEIWSKREDL